MMYRKTWRYYRDSAIVWTLFFLLILSVGYALRNPAYWIAVLLIWYIRNPVRKAFFHAHPSRRISWPEKTALHFRDVTFSSRDGLSLFGRFLAGRNQATILLVHGLGMANRDMLIHAEFLASAGFGVFMIDLRAHGSSEGDTSTNGLREAEDVAGAVNYLLHRIDVNGQRIGALGVSLGAQAVLRGASKMEYLRALVLESLGPSALSDHVGKPSTFVDCLGYPGHWLYYRLLVFMSGDKDAGVREVIGRIAPRPILLIASGVQEIRFNRLFYQAAHEPKELWELPEGEQDSAILKDSHTYMERVVSFFQRELLAEPAGEVSR